MDWIHVEIVKVDGDWSHWRAIAKALMRVESGFVVVLPEEGMSIPGSCRFLARIVALFGVDERVGGVSSVEVVRRRGAGGMWEFLRAGIVDERRSKSVAGNVFGGGVLGMTSCMVAFRTEIVKRRDFVSAFLRGEVREVDVGLFLARWVVEAGYKIQIQHSEETVLEMDVTVDGMRGFLAMTVEEARARWRALYMAIQGEKWYWFQ